MNYRVLFVAAVLAWALCIPLANAQETALSAGGEATGGGGAASYSIGQLFYTTISGESATAAQGIQLGYEITVVTAVKEARPISLSVAAYPNPAQNQLKLEIPGLETADMYWQLYNSNGKLLAADDVAGQLTRIDMSGQVPGVYLLKVIRNDQSLKTLQIIKK